MSLNHSLVLTLSLEARRPTNAQRDGKTITYRCGILVGRMQAGLDQVLAFGLCHERLKLGCGECVNETRFRDNQQEDLCTCECAQLVRLDHDKSVPKDEFG